LIVHSVLNNGKDNHRKFNAKLDKGIFLSYSLANRIFIKRTLTIEESIPQILPLNFFLVTVYVTLFK